MAAARPPISISTDGTLPVPPSGWLAVDGFALPSRPWDLADRKLICQGAVASDDDASASLLAVIRGAGIHVHLCLTGDALRRYLEDLERLAEELGSPVDDGTAVLPKLQRDLLDALARGRTATEAAVELHVSRRTVNRLLADIRGRFGVATTAEAVTRWVELSR